MLELQIFKQSVSKLLLTRERLFKIEVLETLITFSELQLKGKLNCFLLAE